ncbi:alpha/beta hydrolase [Mycobacterium sp. pUA109]|uniref:alpha/beta hydrolase n=1 Tax=Mycobacterium sp. pUA109 TaxID=3238982 RepID=UPI00351B321E
MQSQVLGCTLRATVKVGLRAWVRTRWLPWPYCLIDHAGRALRPIPGVTYQPQTLTHCEAEIVTPGEPTSGRFILYLHGGAFYIGGRYLHRQMVGRFATMLAASALHVDYRKLPRHSINDAVADGIDAYRHMLDMGIDPERIVVMGDSAGGYLTFTTALGIRDAGLPMPAALVAISPLTTCEISGKLAAPSAKACALFSESVITRVYDDRVRLNRGEVLLSPADCNLSGLPPTLIQASSSEMLYPDAVLMADRLADAGVPCTLQTWPGQVHVFQAAAALVPESAQAVAEVVDFIDHVVPAIAELSA